MASGYSPPSDSAVAGGEVQPAPMGLWGGGWPWEITHSHQDRGTEKWAATNELLSHMCFKASLLQIAQLFVIHWDLFAIFQNHWIVGISPLHLCSELLYKKILLGKKGKKVSPPK